MSPLNRCALDFPLPGIPSDVDDSEDANLLEQPVFNFAEKGNDSWSSLDSGSSKQEGDYTGKFRDLHVLTKIDPPTSATRERIEQWGRPISPFPRRGSPIPEDVGDKDDDEASDLDLLSAGISKSSSPARSARRSSGVVIDGVGWTRRDDW